MSSLTLKLKHTILPLGGNDAGGSENGRCTDQRLDLIFVWWVTPLPNWIIPAYAHLLRVTHPLNECPILVWCSAEIFTRGKFVLFKARGEIQRIYPKFTRYLPKQKYKKTNPQIFLNPKNFLALKIILTSKIF